MTPVTYYALKTVIRGIAKVGDVVDGTRQRKVMGFGGPPKFRTALVQEKVCGACLLFPPRFGVNANHFDPKEIIRYWETNPYTPNMKGLLTLGEYIVLRLLDGKNPLDLTARQIANILIDKVEIPVGTPIMHEHRDLKVNGFEIARVAVKLQLKFEDNQISGIEKYNDLIGLLSKLEGATRHYMTHICELHYEGPLEYLAMSADIANIRYITRKVKPLNMIQLIHKLCGSPTWQGKITALISLIELFEIDLMKAATTSISVLANAVLKIVTYIVDYTEVGTNYLKKTFNWTSASDEEQLQSASTKKCYSITCSKPIVEGCSLCIKHWCKDCGPCACSGYYQHEMAACQCDMNNDCFWRALAAQTGQTITALKWEMFQFLLDEKYDSRIETWIRYYDIANLGFTVEGIKEKVKESIKIHVMAEIETVLLTALCFDLNILIKSHIGSESEIREIKFRKYAKWLKLSFFGNHYERDTQNKEFNATVNLFGGEVYPWIEDTYSEIEIESIKSDKTQSTAHLSIARSEPKPFKINSPALSVKDNEYVDVFFKTDEEKVKFFKQKEPQTEPESELEKDLQNTAKKNVPHELFNVDLIGSSSATTSTSLTTDTHNNEYINTQLSFISSQQNDEVDNEATKKTDVSEDTKPVPEIVKETEMAKKKKSTFSEWIKSIDLGEQFQVVQDWLENASKDIILWFDDNPLISGLFAICSGIASFFGLYVNLPTTRTGFGGVIDRFNGATRTMHYARSGFNGILSAMSDTFAEMRNFLGISSDKEITEFKQRVGDMLVQCKEMYLLAQTEPAKFINNSRKFLEFKVAMADIMKGYQNLTTVKTKDSRALGVLTPIWFNLCRTWENLSQMYTKFVNGMSTRKVPVCLYIYGTTGIGKSALLTQLINDLNIKMKREMKIFTVSKGTEFWNNYAQQEIIRFDDMNAVVGTEGDIDSVMLMNLVTDAPWNPNQASLTDKYTMANPSFVICASNHETVPQNTIISDVPAWESRRHICIDVSYPEHERKCRIRDPFCEHFKERDITKFDHLTFRSVNPCMSEVVTRRAGGMNGMSFNTPTREEIATDGVVITYEQLLDEMIKLEALHAQRYEAALQTAIKSGTAFPLQSKVFAEQPTVALVGPPGTGKSHIFNMVAAGYGDNCMHIKTLDKLHEYCELVKGGKFTKKCAILDDISSFIFETESCNMLQQFLTLVQARFDLPENEVTHILFIGVNKNMFIDKFSDETYNQIFRRCNIINVSFRKMNFKDKCAKYGASAAMKTKYYDHTFTKSDPANIDLYVKYEFKGKEQLQQVVAKSCLNYTPVVKEINIITQVEECVSVQASCHAKIKMTHSELVDAVNDYDFTSILKILNCSEVKRSPTSKFSKMDLFKKIADLCRKCKSVEPVVYDSVDDIFIQAHNSQFLEFFKGECAVLQLTDYVIFVDYLGDKARIGRLSDPKKEIEMVKNALGEVLTIDMGGLLDGLSTTMLPPWVLLATEAITTALTFIFTGAAMAIGVHDQQKMFNAYRTDLRLEKILDVAKEAHNINSQGKLAKRNDVAIPGIVPGLGYPSAPQYGLIDDMGDYFDNATVESSVRTKEPSKNALRHESSVRTKNPDKSSLRIVNESFELKKKQQVDTAKLRQEMGLTDLPILPTEVDHTGNINEAIPEEAVENIKKNSVASFKRRAKRIKQLKISDNSNSSPLQSEHVTPESYFERPIKDISKTTPVMESDEVIKLECTTTGEDVNFNEDTIVQEVCVDPSLYSIVKVVFKSTCEIISRDGTRLCSGLFIGGRIVRTVRHVLDSCKDILVRDIEKNVWTCRVLKEDEWIDRLDLEILEPNFPEKRNMIDHFPPSSRVINDGDLACMITPDFTVGEGIVAYSLRTYTLKQLVYKNFTALSKKYYVLDYRGHRAGFRTNGPIQTTNGDCGSILVLCNPNITAGKVLGMHIAATMEQGFASPFWREQYAEVRMECIDNTPKLPSTLYNTIEGQYPIIGQTKNRNFLSAKTKLFRNIYSMGPKVYEPAILSSRDPRCKNESMLFKECGKWLDTPVELEAEDKTLLFRATDEIAKHYVDVMKSHSKTLRVLTKTEALNKLRESSHSEPINIHTSAGYPYNIDTIGSGKTDFITVLADGSRRFNKKHMDRINKLYNDMDLLMNEHKTGKYKPVVFQAFLKDEPVKLEKIYCEPEKQKTRTIAAAPLDFQILFRQYFHSAHAAMMDLHRELPTKVGINPLSVDWHELYMSLAEKSNFVVSSDFKGWDFSHNPFFVDLIEHFYNVLYSSLDENYDPQHTLIRRTLYSKIKNFLLLIGDSVCQTQKGIPSGYPGTSPDNSLVNLILSVAAWIKIMDTKMPSLANYFGFREDVANAIYSDDKLESVSLWASKFYNGLTIPPIVKKFGFDMQPATKKGDFDAYHHIKESVFLSRNFKLLHGIWIGPLKVESIFKSTWYVHDTRAHYYHESPDEQCQNPESIVSSWESALYEASLHGKKFFDQVRENALKVHMLYPLRLPPTYEQCMSRTFSSVVIQPHKAIEHHKATKEIMSAAEAIKPRPSKFSKFGNRETWSYGEQYDYTGCTDSTNKTTPNVQKLLDLVNNYFELEFNNVHINKYGIGGSIPWHKDDEDCLEQGYPIVGLTIYGDGILQFKGDQSFQFYQGSGIMYIMKDFMLTEYLHRRVEHRSETMSVTFRRIIPQ